MPGLDEYGGDGRPHTSHDHREAGSPLDHPPRAGSALR